MKTKNIVIILLVILLSVFLGYGFLRAINHGDGEEKTQSGVLQNITQNTKVKELPKGVKVDDIEIVYLAKTTYEENENAYKTKDLYDEEANTFVQGVAQLVNDADCSNLNRKIENDDAKYKYLVQGYNSDGYIEFRIEIYVYNESSNKKIIVQYDKLKDYYNPEEYILDNDEAVNYIVKYMDEMQGDEE